MTAAPSPSRRTLNERLFDALPFAPAWLAAGGALLLLGLFLAMMSFSGDLGRFVETGTPWWRDRDGRLGVLLALLAAYLPVARRYEQLGTKRTLDLLRETGAWPPAPLAAASQVLEITNPATLRRVGWLGLLVLPLLMLGVDPDPKLLMQADYWGTAQLWTRALAAVVCWNSAALMYAVWSHARGFSRLAAALPDVDLLDLESLTPFNRQRLVIALPLVVVLSFFGFNLIDPGLLLPFGAVAALLLLGTAVALSHVAGGVRERIRRAKREELARINAAIRGKPGALAGSALPQREVTDLGGLLAYREFVASVPESPGTVNTRGRLLLLVAIPVGSWLGGALVERILAAFLG
jgi:hypothetical protein